jgi:hypothetical protein
MIGEHGAGARAHHEVQVLAPGHAVGQHGLALGVAPAQEQQQQRAARNFAARAGGSQAGGRNVHSAARGASATVSAEEAVQQQRGPSSSSGPGRPRPRPWPRPWPRPRPRPHAPPAARVALHEGDGVHQPLVPRGHADDALQLLRALGRVRVPGQLPALAARRHGGCARRGGERAAAESARWGQKLCRSCRQRRRCDPGSPAAQAAREARAPPGAAAGAGSRPARPGRGPAPARPAPATHPRA